MSKLEMPGLPWFNVEEEIERLKKIGTVEWICHLRPVHLPWECLEDMPLTYTVRNKFVKEALTSLKSS